MSELNDKELFEHAISDTPAEAPAETPAAPAAEVDAGQPRDDQGRFAAKEQQPVPQPTEQPQAQQPAQADREAHVPSWRLREVNEAREAAERRAQEAFDRAQAFERQLAELQQSQQPKPEPVDFFADPAAAFKQNLAPLETQFQGLSTNLNLKVSRVLAVVEHGKEAVSEMEKAIGEAMRSGNPELGALRLQMQNSDDPVGVAMQWYQRDKLVRETGGDVTAYRNKLLEDSLKDPAFLARALEAAKAQASGQAPGTRPNTVVQLPPSINRQASAASPHEDAGDLSNGSLYAFATR